MGSKVDRFSRCWLVRFENLFTNDIKHGHIKIDLFTSGFTFPRFLLNNQSSLISWNLVNKHADLLIALFHNLKGLMLLEFYRLCWWQDDLNTAAVLQQLSHFPNKAQIYSTYFYFVIYISNKLNNNFEEIFYCFSDTVWFRLNFFFQ